MPRVIWASLICTDKGLGPLFKHLGPGVLEHPPSPFATKGEEMEEQASAAATAAEGTVCVKSTERMSVRACGG